MNKKKNILIAGYPKSGTNWLSRLVAEVLQCNFNGDWGFDTKNASRLIFENTNSEYQVFKSHHFFSDIKTASKEPIYKIIYIVRDPRDIVISGTYFFNFNSLLIKVLNKLSLGFIKSDLSFIKKKKKMINAVLYGDYKITPWLALSWEKHVTAYITNDIYFIKYEDLLDNTEKEIQKLIAYLNLNIANDQIEKSVKKQCFENRKKEVVTLKHKNLNKLVRKGSQGYWKNNFTEKEKNLFKEELNNKIEYYYF